MEAELRTRVKAVCDRADWGLRPQAKALPAVRLTKVSSPRGYRMDGAQATQQYRVQMDCYGATYKAAKELGDALIAAIEPATGSFQASFVIGDRDFQEVLETTPIFNRSLDFKVTFISA